MTETAVKRTPGRGRFISFEGGEGSGKSTQIKTLSERLDAAKLRAIVTREPGGSPGAEIIRHLVLSGMGNLVGPDAETLLFAAARDDHVRSVILPALNQGIWVLCDRFSDSTRVYQGRLGQVAPAVLNAMGMSAAIIPINQTAEAVSRGTVDGATGPAIIMGEFGIAPP